YDSTNIDSMIAQFTVKKFIVIVDTNYNYFILRQKMFDLSEKLDIKIDTIDRGYDKAKDIIMSEGADEIYTKGYFPRRFNGISLSLEYYEYFLKWMNFEQKNIALVAGIFTEKKEADSLLFQIKKIEPKSFMLKTDLYIGCMH
ncbi:MAG: hypothetical protein P1P88_15595, partial [Bacteroidales bacterium]|nr:hypothetical protein [Bacteroidales bacterium]